MKKLENLGPLVAVVLAVFCWWLWSTDPAEIKMGAKLLSVTSEENQSWAEIEFVNDSKADIVIVTVVSSCNCISPPAEFPLSIGAGGIEVVKFQVKPQSGTSDTHRAMRVITNPMLTSECVVEFDLK